jgi:hypothetical protein
MTRRTIYVLSFWVLWVATSTADVTLSGRILENGDQPVAARLYIEALDGDDVGKFFTVGSADTEGRAVAYEKLRGVSSEVHTALSAHPFRVVLPEGKYRLTIERGKEYRTLIREVNLASDQHFDLIIERWINMAERGWYSGDTHVHGRYADMPTLALAEDLNVSFPLTAWVTDSEHAPTTDNKSPDPVPPGELVTLDEDHVIWPVNTEYEIFTVKGVRHTLGAVFALNHKKPLTLAAPPVRPAIEQARAQGAVIDIDKHNWPWSIMLIPVVKPDLFELSNNHIWRTQFMFRDWYKEYAFGPFEDIEKNDEGGFTERGWIDFGFRNYYALLNCGFRMMPTAGTAHGVHPVPLGFGRVYVDMRRNGGQLDYGNWLANLKAGNSFVTTGPMIEWSVAPINDNGEDVYYISGSVESVEPLIAIELIVNGEVRLIDMVGGLGSLQLSAGGKALEVERRKFTTLVEAGSSWFAIRAFAETSDGRPRFVHTAPMFIDIPGKPLLPKKAEVEYLLKRVEDEIARHDGVLGEAAMAEYAEAADHYRNLLKIAR